MTKASFHGDFPTTLTAEQMTSRDRLLLYVQKEWEAFTDDELRDLAVHEAAHAHYYDKAGISSTFYGPIVVWSPGTPPHDPFAWFSGCTVIHVPVDCDQFSLDFIRLDVKGTLAPLEIQQHTNRKWPIPIGKYYECSAADLRHIEVLKGDAIRRGLTDEAGWKKMRDEIEFEIYSDVKCSSFWRKLSQRQGDYYRAVDRWPRPDPLRS